MNPKSLTSLNHEAERLLESRAPKIEREADEFAAEILLPRRLLLEERGLGGGPLWNLNLPELARRYRVSRQALAIRLEEWEQVG